MDISRRNRIIAGIAAVALLIAIVIAVVIAVNKNATNPNPNPNPASSTTPIPTSTSSTTPSPTPGPQPFKPGIFKRCDGRPDPVEQIKISSCPNSAEVGYCEIKANTTTEVEMTFTPVENFDDASFRATAPYNDVSFDACHCDVRCPLRAGVTETLVKRIEPNSFQKLDLGELKFKIYHSVLFNTQVVYCVEFPVKII